MKKFRTLAGIIAAVLMFCLPAVTSTPTAEASGSSCTIQKYKTLLGARTVYRVKCPSTKYYYRAAADCDGGLFPDTSPRGAYRRNNEWSTVSCTFPYDFERGWFQWKW